MNVNLKADALNYCVVSILVAFAEQVADRQFGELSGVKRQAGIQRQGLCALFVGEVEDDLQADRAVELVVVDSVAKPPRSMRPPAIVRSGSIFPRSRISRR